MVDQKPKKKKKNSALGKQIGVYRQSRLDALLFIAGAIIIGSGVIFFMNNTGEQPLWLVAVGVSWRVTLPGILLGALIWFLIGHFFPLKTIVLHENGLQVATKKSLESYQWEEIPNIIRTIVKEEESRKVLHHEYVIRGRDGSKAVSFANKDFPTFDSSRFDKILKQAHVKGVINLDSKIRWESRNDD